MPSRTRSLSCGWRGGGGGHLRDPTRRPQDSNFRSCGRVRSGGHVYRPIRHHCSRYYGSPQDTALNCSPVEGDCALGLLIILPPRDAGVCLGRGEAEAITERLCGCIVLHFSECVPDFLCVDALFYTYSQDSEVFF